MFNSSKKSAFLSGTGNIINVMGNPRVELVNTIINRDPKEAIRQSSIRVSEEMQKAINTIDSIHG